MRNPTVETRWTSKWITNFKRDFAQEIETLFNDCREAGIDVDFPDPYSVKAVDEIARLADTFKEVYGSDVLSS